MKPALLFILVTTAAFAQFRSIDVVYQDTGCATCIQSIGERMRRMRGVESAELDTAKHILRLRLAAGNRVRLEQVRDLVEQDGTKAVHAAVTVAGELSRQESKWILAPTGLTTRYEIEPGSTTPPAGAATVSGEVKVLRPGAGGLVVIHAHRVVSVSAVP